MFVGVAGNIGSGKTTLTGLLTNRFGWVAHYESVDENPYMTDFYNNMNRWSFNIQVYFLTQRFKSIQSIQWTNSPSATVIQDRTIYEDVYIFAENLVSMGLMSARDYKTYLDLFSLMNSFIRQPDLIIYLKASVQTLLHNIRQRNRSFEVDIDIHYLERLNESYERWADSYKGEMLVIDVDNLNFSNKETLEKILSTIERATNNLKK